MEPIVLDGRTGEGGGQLVRLACGLAALTCQPVTIQHVRGNRRGGRGGGLKVQHVTSLSWLAKVTDAEVHGLAVGSENLTFKPRRSPAELVQRNFEIEADTDAASALLILQAIFPYVLFAGNDTNEPVVLHIYGGTNVHWSLSYEYFDQVLMPVFEERFGVRVQRELKTRGWNLGPRSRGHIALAVHPVRRGESLKFMPPPRFAYPSSYQVLRVDASIIAPRASHETVQEELGRSLGQVYPDAEIHFEIVEDSGHDTRWSILLVAHSPGGIRWGRDSLFSMPKKLKSTREKFIQRACARLCEALYEETTLGGTVDEFLQDQLVAVQALAEGFSTFPRGRISSQSTDGLVEKLGTIEVRDDTGTRKEKTHEPFGNGSTHTTTARWVASELLPGAEFHQEGDTVKGVGFCVL
ncbi:hypothetical protein C2857_005213 [Epichloe festucae Fl1]|uniref:RNA 3'-terminal phosphate cyclase domain-containing protein n=1 Tax=Epichloe festucae (strain Fl1) TaxID=877507 RepID=A0A7S9KPE3_EPIFF|nr:hypothetical protein C2857_005213 [Epichloe festucae Fl1]